MVQARIVTVALIHKQLCTAHEPTKRHEFILSNSVSNAHCFYILFLCQPNFLFYGTEAHACCRSHPKTCTPDEPAKRKESFLIIIVSNTHLPFLF